MKGEHNRDRAVERLLRESPLEGMSSQACVEAETLAAWSERYLSPAEARTVEAHVSQCERCQSMLAVFARSEPVAAAAAPVWRRWHLRWLVPATAMAAALAIWVAVPPARPTPPAQTALELEQGTAAQRAVSPDDGTMNATASPEAQLPPSAVDGRQFRIAPAPPPQSGQQGQQVGDAIDPRERDRLRSSQRREADRAVEGASRGQLESAAAARNDQAANSARSLGQPPTRIGPADAAELTSQSAAKAEAEASSAAADSLRQQSAAPPPPVVPSSPPAPAAPAAATGAATAIAGAQPGPAPKRFDRAGASGVRVPFVIESPDARHRWSIDPGGQLQHSSSAGATWQAVSMSGSDVLTAGMSPEGSVCWLVGRGGAVWLTTDGLRFDRRQMPEPVDLISVRASDGRRATVAAVDGRTFVTADGGVTWKVP